MTEYQFKVNETTRPIFLKADTESEALDTLSMLGYTVKVEHTLTATASTIDFDRHMNAMQDMSENLSDLNIGAEKLTVHNDDSEYDPLAFLKDYAIEKELDFTPKEIVSPKEIEIPKVSKLDTTKECDCCNELQTKELEMFGRTLYLCDTCYAKELPSSKIKQETTYGNNLNDKIEQVVAKIVDVSQPRWQLLYNEERPAWILSNFDSPEHMRDKLIEFISRLENEVFESKAKMRAAYDSGREMEAKLSKSQRDALINDPNFKVPENSQYKQAKVRSTKEDKARKDLMDMGMSKEEIDAFLGGKK